MYLSTIADAKTIFKSILLRFIGFIQILIVNVLVAPCIFLLNLDKSCKSPRIYTDVNGRV